MFSTYLPNTVTGGDFVGFEPQNVFCHSWINSQDWKFIMDFLNHGRGVAVMAGCFDDKIHKGRVGKLDKEAVGKFDEYFQGVLDRLHKQCLL